ncbi:hybrid sensor histidine kinase/response regulator [Methylocapsa sp. S129]|uniref:ATP-binding response regulator n=1 Tax=Methylocapsa sp. S129 TaxID=1641869 RepID=UPI00131A6955|nr:hybrid sensor histidine kinase/response regulator [Methylocapsa sp. S129]
MSNEETSTERLDHLRADQVDALYHRMSPGTFGGLIAGTVLSGMLVHMDAITLNMGLAFLAILAAQSAARFFLVHAYHAYKPAVVAWRHWALGACATALAGGLSWGLGSLLLLNSAHPELQMLVFLVCAGMAAGAITAFATYLPAYYMSLFSIMTPTMVWSAAQGDALHWTYAVLASLWVVVIAILARTFSQILDKSLQLQFENLDLAIAARRQKELAEDANIAKSRFLAAASHDLRQPVHALGLFVEALRGREMDGESHRLVGQIGASIAALDGLFVSLLDISRLDAGVVESRPSEFPIQPLLERICRDEAPEAERKGIALTLEPCSMNVRSDPVLLERILRNLVSNAVRYTDNGRVLVGCRRGERLSVEIWDTGCGIAQDHRDLIFQEFYQIGNPERDRTRGLGLGLAIVRRLTAILEIPLSFRSQPDKGTVFKLSLAPGAADQAIPAPTEELNSGMLSERFIVVVDDELAIQDAMRAVLTAWGHSVVVAGSSQEMLERVAERSVRPDLVICDLRLRGDENGLDAIQRLRSKFRENIPAILITGDTESDRLKRAGQSGCFVMHKPVSNSRLRAAISNLTMSDAPLQV